MEPLKDIYFKKLAPDYEKKYDIKNVNAISRPSKVVINIGAAESLKDSSVLETLERDLTLIAGQKPVRTRARKSISEFALKQGDVIGLKVTLRRDRMWHFLDKLVNIVLPRVKDFRGISNTAFDESGNYTLGILEYSIFPEIDPTKVTKIKGLSITITFSGKDKEKNKYLMEQMGFIFKKA